MHHSDGITDWVNIIRIWRARGRRASKRRQAYVEDSDIIVRSPYNRPTGGSNIAMFAVTRCMPENI